MIKKIGLVLAVLVVALVVYAAVKSPDYEVSREITIDAPADKVFPYLNNMMLAEKWGPWKEVDPQTQMTHSGPEQGVGAKTSWQGGKEMGTGSATIVESVPNERVTLKLEYTEPVGMVQDADYLIAAAADKSTVTWRVRGKNNFIGRLLCLFANIDTMVGPMFEKGLSNLKRIVETPG